MKDSFRINKGRVAAMKGLPEERAVLLGRYIAENGATVRKAAKVFQISKSTVHMVVIKMYGLSG